MQLEMLKNKNLKLIKQFINFGIVGLSNTGIYLAVYYTLLFFNLDYIVAYCISFVISILNAYYWNDRYVFKKQTSGHFIPFFKMFCAYGVTFLLSVGLLIIIVDNLSISKIVAPIINLLVTVPLNFLLNKMWAFK